MRRKKKKYARRGPTLGQKLLALVGCVLLAGLVALLCSGGDSGDTRETLPEGTPDTVGSTGESIPVEDAEDPEREAHGGFFQNTGSIADILDAIFGSSRETEEVTFGIDVAKYQGTIDWAQVAESGIDFAMVRVGYRTLVDGDITADPNGKYNLQEAQKYGIKLGVYFFSTAVTEEEAREEARWVAEYISQYPITYPVAYNCEGFNDPENRQYGLSKQKRTDIALAFLKTIGELGYEPMFYASRNEMQDDALWEVSRIENQYKVWVAQYPEKPYPETEQSDYEGLHQMWQYTRSGIVPGISGAVDLNVAYFGYSGTEDAKNKETPEEVEADAGAMMEFRQVNEQVTAKVETNLRDKPSQDTDSTVMYTLKNGEVATRIGISDTGWSKVSFNGGTYYAVSSYLTTDLNHTVPVETEADDGIETEFTPVNESVTAKDLVNLRNLPSVTHEDSNVEAQLRNGETATRVGISDNGWSKLSYNGKTYYAVSSYLTTELDSSGGQTPEDDGIDTVFTEVSESVTAKDVVNLRTLPSVTDENSQIVAQLKNGEVVTRTGINTDVGWSRVEYNGQTLYCVSSYLTLAE